MQPTTTLRTAARRRDGFRAMGTDVSLYGSDADAFDEAFAAIRRVFETEERRFSRFRDDSELTAVNRLAGQWVAVSSPFERVVRLALDHASATGGLFDPTVLHALMAAGYDRDFDEVLAGARGVLHPPQPCGRWTEVQVCQGAVRLPPEVGLDLGGIAKGWTVDLAAAEALDAGLGWAVVAAGGDLAIVGDAPVLEIPIEDPETLERPMATLRLARGALATSSVAKRSWGTGLHHVIDPRTGAPLRSDTVQATVWAPTCAEAEVLATWALLRGPDAADQLSCAIVTSSGDVVVSFDQEMAP
jgi:FAD:protein FMN transferase